MPGRTFLLAAALNLASEIFRLVKNGAQGLEAGEVLVIALHHRPAGPLGTGAGQHLFPYTTLFRSRASISSTASV